MDHLVMGSIILEKLEQKPFEKDTKWQQEFELD